MKTNYTNIKNYTLISGAFLFMFLLGSKPAKTDSAVFAYNANNQIKYKIIDNPAFSNIDSSKTVQFKNIVKTTPKIVECDYNYTEDTIFVPQKNYLLENGIEGYSNYSVKNSGKKLTFLRNDTIICIRENGTLPWRNNNPGAIKYGAFAKKYGAIGKGNRGFAVFPTREVGIHALKALLQSDSYKDLSISAAMEIFAPRHENNTDSYKRHITKLTGVSVTKKLRDLSRAEFERVVAAIIKLEGSVTGKETLFTDGKPVVKKDTNVNLIVDTLICQNTVKTL